MKKYLLFALPFFVVGCSEEVKSVDWWGQHLTEAKQMFFITKNLMKCRNADSIMLSHDNLPRRLL